MGPYFRGNRLYTSHTRKAARGDRLGPTKGNRLYQPHRRQGGQTTLSALSTRRLPCIDLSKDGGITPPGAGGIIWVRRDVFHVGLVRRRRFSDNCTIRTLQFTIQHAKTCVHSVHSVDRGLQAFLGHMHVIRSHPNGCATALSTQPTSGHDDRIATRARRGAVVPPFSFWILLVPDIDASCHLRRRQGARRSSEPGVRE